MTKVFTNAMAMNAVTDKHGKALSVGSRVWSDNDGKGNPMTIEKIDGNKVWMRDENTDSHLTIHQWNPSVWNVLNSVATNAKFKVGDACKVYHHDKWVDGKITKVDGNYADVKLSDSFGTTITHLSTTGTFAAVQAKNSVARNAFKNPRFVPAAQYDLDELPAKMKRALKKQKDDFIHWYSSDIIDGIEAMIRRINNGLSSGEGDESEVKALKEMKPKYEKYLAEAKAVISKVNALS